MATRGEEAWFFAQALRLGLVNSSQVIAWAHRCVHSDLAFVDELAQISFSELRSKLDIVKLLDAVPGPGDRSVSDRLVLALLHRALGAGHISLDQVAEHVCVLTSQTSLSVDEWIRLLANAREVDGDLTAQLARYAPLVAELPEEFPPLSPAPVAPGEISRVVQERPQPDTARNTVVRIALPGTQQTALSVAGIVTVLGIAVLLYGAIEVKEPKSPDKMRTNPMRTDPMGTGRGDTARPTSETGAEKTPVK